MIWDFLNEAVLGHSGEAVMAWVQFLPAIIGAVSGIGQTIAGARKERKARREMEASRKKMEAENEALYNEEYYGDYMKRADVQQVIRSMREDMKGQAKADAAREAVLGTTPGVAVANKERRNRAMADLYGKLAAQGQLYKDNAKNRYLSRKYALQGMEYDTLGQQAQSGNNLLYNGLNGLANAGWAALLGMRGGGKSGGAESGGAESGGGKSGGSIEGIDSTPPKGDPAVYPDANYGTYFG